MSPVLIQNILFLIVIIIVICVIAMGCILYDQWKVLKSTSSENKVLKSKLESAKAELEHLSKLDIESGTLNLIGINEIYELEIKKKLNTSQPMSAVIIHIDNLTIDSVTAVSNSGLVLKEIAKKIKHILRPQDSLGRIGIADFFILLPDTQLAFAIKVGERIRQSLSQANFGFFKDGFTLTSSIGVIAIEDDFTFEYILTQGNKAVTRSKITGGDKVAIAGNTYLLENIDNANDAIDTICDGDSVRTLFQKIVDFKTNSIYGYEIYARGPVGSFESPDDFFQLSAEYNVLTKVDLICLRACIEAVRKIHGSIRFHINLFPATLIRCEPSLILNPLIYSGTSHNFCIELSQKKFITEELILLKEKIQLVKQSGVFVAIDDLGLDNESMQRILILEPDIIKLDRIYTNEVAKNVMKKRFITRLVNVSKSLGSEVIAEGVEAYEDKDALINLGIKLGQGYLFGKPIEVLPEEK